MKTVAELNKSIDQIKRTGEKFDNLVQETGVAVLEHFSAHKDTGLVNRLFLAMPKGSRKNALGSWLLAYCAVAVNTKKETLKEQPFVYKKDGNTDPVAAALDPWYNHKPEKPLDVEFDMLTAVRALLRKLEASTKLEHYGPAQQEALKALAASVGIASTDVPNKLPVLAEEAPM